VAGHQKSGKGEYKYIQNTLLLVITFMSALECKFHTSIFISFKGGGGNQTDVMQGLGLGSAYSATKGLLTSVNR